MAAKFILLITSFFLIANCKKDKVSIAAPSGLNVRSLPDQSSQVLSKLYYGQTAELLKEKKTDSKNQMLHWVKIKFTENTGGQEKVTEGWVSEDFIASTEEKGEDKVFLDAFLNNSKNFQSYSNVPYQIVLNLHHAIVLSARHRSYKYRNFNEAEQAFQADFMAGNAYGAYSGGGRDFCYSESMFDYLLTSVGSFYLRLNLMDICGREEFLSNYYSQISNYSERLFGKSIIDTGRRTELGFNALNTDALNKMFKRLYLKPDQIFVGIRMEDLYKRHFRFYLMRFLDSVNRLENLKDLPEFQDWVASKAKADAREYWSDSSYYDFHQQKANLEGSNAPVSVLDDRYDYFAKFVMRRKIDGSMPEIKRILKLALTDYDPELLKRYGKIL